MKRFELFRAVEAADRGTGRAEAVAIARQVLAGSPDDDAFRRASLVLVHAGEIALAHSRWGAATTVARDVHAVVGARIMLLRGEVRAAVRLLHGAVERGVRPALRTTAAAWLALALVEAGELGRARAALRTGHQDDPELCFARGRVLLAEGQGAAALDEFLDCGRVVEARGVVNPAVLPWRSAASLAATDRGDLVLARICADKDLVAARRWGARWAVGLALHASALARGGDDVLLEEAITCLDRAPEALRARHDLAQLLLTRGEVERARRHTRHLREAGGPQWTKAADALTARLLRNDGESALSGRQRRIALLARAGRSNREIAAELGLTLRTVEFHLTAVYRKMGVAGRAGLRRALIPTA